MGGRDDRTLLDALVRRRRLTRHEALELLARRARGMGIMERRFALSERQFYRLLHGEVKTRPHPVVCRVLEAEFGCPIENLLAPAGGEDEATGPTSRLAAHPVGNPPEGVESLAMGVKARLHTVVS